MGLANIDKPLSRSSILERLQHSSDRPKFLRRSKVRPTEIRTRARQSQVGPKPNIPKSKSATGWAGVQPGPSKDSKCPEHWIVFFRPTLQRLLTSRLGRVAAAQGVQAAMEARSCSILGSQNDCRACVGGKMLGHGGWFAEVYDAGGCIFEPLQL